MNHNNTARTQLSPRPRILDRKGRGGIGFGNKVVSMFDSDRYLFPVAPI